MLIPNGIGGGLMYVPDPHRGGNGGEPSWKEVIAFIVFVIGALTVMGVLFFGFLEGLIHSDSRFGSNRCEEWPATKGDLVMITMPLGCKIGKWWSEPIDPLERE